MKSTAIVCAIAASALGFSSLSFAQGSGYDRDHRSERREDRRDDRRDERQARRDARHEQRGQHHQPQYQVRQHQERHYQPQYQQHHQPHYQPHYQAYYQAPYQQYYPQHQWSGHGHRYQRGDHLPYQFRQHQYYVNDWRSHRGLYAPPYGYQWVQADGGDYLLVALATGLIANLLLSQY